MNEPVHSAAARQRAAAPGAGLLDALQWSPRLVIFGGIAALAVILDGFDNQVLGFALPAIIRDWGLDRGAFAPVLAAGLVGMTLGAGFGGLLGDRYGRKSSLVACLGLLGVATAAMANSHSVTQLGVLRMLAGVGIGGALPNVSALVAELSPTRNRAAVVTLTIVCVPLGGMIGGLVASAILPWLGWRALFTLGGVAPLIMAVIFWRLMPESPQFLLRCPRRAGELQRLLSQLQCEIPANATFGTKANGAVASESRLASILRPPYRFDTWALWGAFGCCLFAVYSVFSWAPTLLTESRFTLAEASRAVGVYNFGGVLGALICASAVGRFGSRRLLISLASLAVTSAVGLWLVAASAAVNHGVLVALLGFHGFCVNGVQTSLYGLAACAYPVHFRSTGVGAASSVGRIGAIVSSFSGAALLGPHSGNFYLLLALSMAGNAVCLILLRAHIPRFGASEPPQMRSECLTATHPTKVV